MRGLGLHDEVAFDYDALIFKIYFNYIELCSMKTVERLLSSEGRLNGLGRYPNHVT